MSKIGEVLFVRLDYLWYVKNLPRIASNHTLLV